ncbi:VOC family protein [Streptomyces sp. NPDC056656]|uniref:VOC family protein n=1 Tax=Streptomyces sp. NPDC056656 TaxID=3345895 RepID=UPI003675F3AF
MAATARLSHVGICVTDVERARRFYCELFGFEETYSRKVSGEEFARLMQRPSLDVQVTVLTLGPQKIELVHHFSPPPVVEPLRSTNTVGFTHAAIYVSDVKATAERVEELGGSALWDTYTRTDVQGEIREYMYIMDPDQVRIELIRGELLG